MTTLIAIILGAFIAALALTPFAKRLAVRLGAVDRPGGRRRVHVREVPRLGGIAVFFPVMAVVGVAFWTMHGEEARVDPHQFLGLAVASGAIFFLGLYDDIRGTNAPTKFGVQILAASVLYFSGLHVSSISTPFGWSMELGIFAFPITLLWLVGLSNAMNLLDGLDGLAAGVSAMAALTIMVMAVGMGNDQVALIAAGLFGTLLGFLPYNFNPASIFLGDCGALFLGFFLAALPIMSNQKAATAVALLIPILSLGIPIFDTSLAFFRRLAEGEHPFQADRRHLHHRLLDRGFNQRKVVLTLYAVSAFLSTTAMFMANASRIGAFLALVAVGMGGVVAVRRLGLEEFHELARKFHHGERRRRPPRAKAMLVRNSVPILKRMTSRQAIEVLLEDIRRNLGFNELVLSIKPEYCPPLLNGAAEIRMTGSILAESLTGNGSYETEPWTATVEILPPETRGSGSERSTFNVQRSTSLGTVTATKPAWMRRRQSDNDLELLTWLADGVGEWLAGLWPELSSQGSASGPGGPAARRGVRGQQRQTKPRILIADDDPRIQDLLRRILLPDYEVATASDGDEALALVCRSSPDCLILDLRLPGLDGFAVCEALRADSATRHVPILILSGLSDPADKVRALELGADDYVTKPFDVPELHARLQALLRRTQPKTSE